MYAAGDVIAEKYVLGQLLATGGMGMIFRATQPALERCVAVKVVRPELANSAGARERFWHEAIAASRAAHRNVIPIIDYDCSRAPVLVMPFLAGERLGNLANEPSAWSLRRIRRVIKQLLAALVATHARMIVHGDIKCDNILVTREDGHECATLIDFGLARLPDHPRIDSEIAISGTPEYLAPEVIDGSPPTAASDLYGVGVILYELLVGTTPFAGGDAPTVLARHLDEPVPPLGDACPWRTIPPSLDRLVRHALEKDPRTRISHAGAFRDALSSIPFARGTTPPPLTTAASDEQRATLDIVREVPIGNGELGVRAAIQHGDVDGIIVAYLEHVRELVDSNELKVAIRELENALRYLATRGDGNNPPKALWRLQLTLAALYDGIGDREHAVELAQQGVAHSRRVGSYVGTSRARALVERLSRRSTRGEGAR